MASTSSTNPIVGREREQAQLRQLLDDAIAGHGSLVLIRGEAGIGKTTLVNDVIHEARQRDCLVLSGGCYDLTATPPYGPWSEAIRDYDEGGKRRDVPAWFGDPEAMQHVGSQAALFEEASRFFAKISAEQVVLVVLEDLHWADQASLEFLRHIGRTLAELRLLLIATYRDDELDRESPLFRLLPHLVRESQAARIEPGAIDGRALDELLQSAYQLPESARSTLAQAVIERTAGNPLFVHELLRMIESQGILRQSASGWELGVLDSLDVPPLIFQMIEARLAAVTSETRNALEVAAVIGQEFPFELWETLLQAPSGMLEIVREATAGQFVQQASGVPSFAFRHALVRQTLYDGLLLPQRIALHRHVAEALLATSAPEPNVVAHHLEHAGDARAADWLIRAGGRAERLYAPFAAIDAYVHALQLLERTSKRDRERGWLMHRVARLYRWHDPERSLPYLQQTLEIARTIEDHTLEAYACFDSGLLRRFVGDIPSSLDMMIDGVEMIDALPPDERERSAASISSLFAEAIPDNTQSGYAAVTMPGNVPGVNLRKPTLAWLLASCGRFDESEAMATSVIQELHEADVERDRVLALAADAFRALGLVHAVRGRPEKASCHLQLAREAAIAKGDHQWIVVGSLLELFLVTIPYETEHLDHRRQLERLIKEELEKVPETRPWLSPASPNEFQMLFTNGHWKAARALALQNLRDSPPRAPLAEQARASSILAALAQRQGKLDEAKRWIASLFPRGPSSLPDTALFFVHERARRVAIEIALDEGNLKSAGELLDAHQTWLDETGCVIGRPETTLLCVRRCLLSGDIGTARTQIDAARDRASNPRQPLALIMVDRLAGELEMQQGKLERAREYLEHSLALADACAVPFELLLSQVSYAELLVAEGDHASANRIIDDARPKLEKMDARPVLIQLDELQMEISRATSSQVNPAGLSDREVEVLEQAATGQTNAEIGETLFISPRTVAQHLRSVYNKLGVNSRAAAVARWAELTYDPDQGRSDG